MKIIQAHKYYYQRAGAERVVLGLSRLLEERGHTVAPFAMRYPKNLSSPWSRYFVSELKTENGLSGPYSAFKMLDRAWWSSEAEKKMGEMIKVFRPDVVHAHNLYTHLSPSVLRACLRHDVPVVLSLHDYALLSANYSLWDGNRSMDLENLSIRATAKTRFIKNSYTATLALDLVRALHQRLRSYDQYISRYIAPSKFVRNLFVAQGFAPEKITVLPLFSDAPMRSKKSDDGFVLFAGRLETYKGVATLIEAMKSFPSVPLKVIGSGEDEARLRTLAKKLNCPVDFVSFMRGEELWDEMRAARVVVVPSVWHEPFGLVALEAMSNSTPIIVSDRGGLKEIPVKGKSGEVFKAGDVRSLVRALAPYLESQAWALERGQAALERASKIGDRNAYLDKILTIYAQAQAVNK